MLLSRVSVFPGYTCFHALSLHSSPDSLVSTVTMYTGGITLSAAWCLACLYGVRVYWRDPWLVLDTVISSKAGVDFHSAGLNPLPPTFIDDLHNFCLHLMMLVFILAASLVGIRCGFACYDEVWYIMSGSSVHVVAKRARGYLLRRIGSTFSSRISLTSRHRIKGGMFCSIL